MSAMRMWISAVYEANVMKVRFKAGTEYHYEGVSKEMFDEILGADSVGRAFNQKVKSDPVAFPFRQIDAGH